MDGCAVAGSIARWMRTQGWEMRAANSSNKELIPRTSDAARRGSRTPRGKLSTAFQIVRV